MIQNTEVKRLLDSLWLLDLTTKITRIAVFITKVLATYHHRIDWALED